MIPKIQHFMWRIMHGILPTCINLVSRFVDVSPFCKRCGDKIETIEHALRDCPWVREFWDNISGVGPLVWDEMGVGRVMNQVDDEIVDIFASLVHLVLEESVPFSDKRTTTEKLGIMVGVQRHDYNGAMHVSSRVRGSSDVSEEG